MAQRRFDQFQYSLEHKVVHLYLKATIGAAGAITLDSANSKGIASITKLGTAGQYQIKLQDVYFKLLAINDKLSTTTGLPAAPAMHLVSGATNTKTAGGGVITVQFSNAGTATNPGSGEVVFAELILGDSSV